MAEWRATGVAGLAAFLLVVALAGAALAQTDGWATSLERVENPRITPGDVLTLIMPGESALTGEFQVDRAGRVMLPEIGAVTLTGETLDAARAKLREALGAVYKNVERLRVILKEQRLLVQVGGYVNEPGQVDLSAEANVQNAIAAAGGLAEGAQLDRMHIQRGGERIPFDYKAFLDSGNPDLLPDLKPLDIIFVPASPVTGNVYVDFDGRDLAEAGDAADEASAVRVFGEVNNPASYAFKPGISVVDMLLRAGGVTRYASVEQLRILSGNEPVTFNLEAYLDSGDDALLPELEPGATIFVPRQSEEVKGGARTIYIMGQVASPGAYEAQADTTFMELLANAGGPNRFANTRQIRIIRVGGGVERFDLQGYTETGEGALPEITPGDAIFIPEKVEKAEPSWLSVPPSRAVQVIGAVKRPGRFEWSDEMSLFDLLAQAGGPTSEADLANLRIVDRGASVAQSRAFDLDGFIEDGGTLSRVPDISAGTVIMVPELPTDPNDNKAQWVRLSKERSIYIMGEVGRPGRYAFNASMGFLDILTAADGPTEKADLRNIRVSRRGKRHPDIRRVNLERYFLTGDPSLLPRVRTGDVIFVPNEEARLLDEPIADQVRILGAVAEPGHYRYSEFMTILDLLAAAGGPTSTALQSRILVVNMSKHEPQASYFDLLKFAKTADTSRLPVIRPGDTIYVPEETEEDLQKAADTMRNIMAILQPYQLFNPSD
jgi:protein involved in polysaccharide export with SLBB domain